MDINITLIGEFITFAIFVWFTMKYIWPPLMQAIADRQKKITDGLAAADQGKRDLELAQHKSVKLIREAKLEASHIVEQANNRAGRIVEEAKESARQEGQRILELANDEISNEKKQALRELEKNLGELSSAVAGKIIKREIDPKAHQDILADVLSEI